MVVRAASHGGLPHDSLCDGAVGGEYAGAGGGSKKNGAVIREFTTPLLILRAVQLGIPLSDLGLLTIGMLNDMYAEAANDTLDWPHMATQDDIDRLL